MIVIKRLLLVALVACGGSRLDPGRFAESRVLFRSEALAKGRGDADLISGRQTITAWVQVQFSIRSRLEVQPGKMDRDAKQQPSARRPASA